MKNKYRAIVFDVDGTLVDTTNLIVKGYVQTLAENKYHKEATSDNVKRSIGGTVAHSLSQMLGIKENDSEIQRLVLYHDTVQDTHPEWIKPYDGVLRTLIQLRKLGFILSIFTSGSTYQVKRNLGAVGIDAERTFDELVTADDDVASKPSPEGIILALEKMNVLNPQTSIYVGDHGVDMQAAKSAGVGLSIGISHGFHNERELRDNGADEVIHDFKSLLTLV